MAEPTVREVERSVRNSLLYARGRICPPILAKHGLLVHVARLETPLEVAAIQHDAHLIARIRRVCIYVDRCAQILDEQIEDNARRDRHLFRRGRWGLPELEQPKPDPAFEAAARRVRVRLAALETDAAITFT